MLAQIGSVAVADFKNRVRDPNFLLFLIALAVLSMIYFPQIGASYQTISVAGARGVYNPYWMGDALAILNVTFLPLVCFYYLRGTIQKDTFSLFGHLFAATRASGTEYILGKCLAHLMILIIVMFSTVIVAIGMQFWIGENRTFDLLAYLLPQLVYVLPLVFMIATITVLFDSVSFLRSTIGNLIYFVVAMIAMLSVINDLTNIGVLLTQISQQANNHIGNTDLSQLSGITVGISKLDPNDANPNFLWQGADYTLIDLTAYIKVCAIVLVGLILAIVSFDRFTASARAPALAQGKLNRLIAKLLNPLDALFVKITQHSLLTRLMRNELSLVFSGKPPLWVMSLFVLFVMQCVLPIDMVKSVIIPAVFLIAGLSLSGLGQREQQHNVQSFMVNCPNLMKVQFPAMLLGPGFMLLTLIAPSIVRLTIDAESFSALMLAIGAVYVVSLAVFCGVVTKTTKAFEILFTMTWYAGPMSQFVYLDFIGMNVQHSQSIKATWVFLIASMIMLAISALWRKKSLEVD
jgi:hypothetical protein